MNDTRNLFQVFSRLHEAKLIGDLTETNKASHFFLRPAEIPLVKAADTVVCERKTMFCHSRKLC